MSYAGRFRRRCPGRGGAGAGSRLLRRGLCRGFRGVPADGTAPGFAFPRPGLRSGLGCGITAGRGRFPAAAAEGHKDQHGGQEENRNRAGGETAEYVEGASRVHL